MKKRLNNNMFIFAARSRLLIAAVLAGILVVGAVRTVAAAPVEPKFLYTLSNFSGPVPFNWVNLYVDEDKNEIYVVDPQKRDVRVFDENGMEIYRFGEDGSLGTVLDVAVKKDGGILALSKKRLKSEVIQCNFRGEPLTELQLGNLPADFSDFSPDRIVCRNERLYLLDSFSHKIVVTELNGLFVKGYDLASILKIEEKKRADLDVGGFSVDREGNMLFTVPALFTACTLSPDGEAKSFGRPGSGPGGFNVVGGIVSDDQGNYYVADRLKCVVLIFDKNFNFQKEFGQRGSTSDNLIGPNNLVLDTLGRLYVSQLKSRGISVFKIDVH